MTENTEQKLTEIASQSLMAFASIKNNVFKKSVHTHVGPVVVERSREGYIREKNVSFSLPFALTAVRTSANTPSCTHGRIRFRFVANKNTKSRRRTCLYGYPDAMVSVQRRNRATCKHFSGFQIWLNDLWTYFFLITCLFYLSRLTAAASRSVSLNGRFQFYFLSVSKLCNSRWSERTHGPLSPNSDIKVGLRAICINILLPSNSDLSRV